MTTDNDSAPAPRNRHRARTTGSVLTDISRNPISRRSAMIAIPILTGIAVIASVTATAANPPTPSAQIDSTAAGQTLTVSPFANWFIPTADPGSLQRTTATKAIDAIGVADLNVEPSSYAQSGIPSVALKAYKKAAKTYKKLDPQCGVTWPLLAAVGRVESGHGTLGDSVMTKSGLSVPSVLGPVLDGAGPFALISDTDNGAYDGDKRYDRAIGPMQFLPETWGMVASDGNGDGKKDVQNIWDAALGAANYFCRGGTRLGTPKGLAANIYRYNRSESYVKLVLGIMREYGANVKIVPTQEAPTSAAAKTAAAKKKVVRKPVVVPTQSPEPTPAPTQTVAGPGTGIENPSGPRVR